MRPLLRVGDLEDVLTEDDAEQAPSRDQGQTSEPQNRIISRMTLQVASGAVVAIMGICAILTFQFGPRHVTELVDMPDPAAHLAAKKWQITSDVTNGDGSQMVLGDNNKVDVRSEQKFENKTIEGKKCEGSGNGVKDMGAAQVVCCYGDNVQCCGEAAAVKTSAKEVGRCESSGGCSEAVVGSKCTRIPKKEAGIQQKRDLHDAIHDATVSNGDRSTQVLGNDNKVKTINFLKESMVDIITRVVGSLAKTLTIIALTTKTSASLAILHQLDYSKQFRSMLIGLPPKLPIDICVESKNPYGARLLCRQDMVPPEKRHVCTKSASEVKNRGKDPANADDWYNMGLKDGTHVRGRHYDEVQCFEKALEIEPEHVRAWSDMGAKGGGSVGGQKYNSMECFLKALEIDPENSEAWSNVVKKVAWKRKFGDGAVFMVGGKKYGSSISVKGKHYSVMDCLRKAIEIDPDNYYAWYKLAYFGGTGGKTILGHSYSMHESFQRVSQLVPDKVAQGCIKEWEETGGLGKERRKECHDTCMKFLEDEWWCHWCLLGSQDKWCSS